MKKRNFIKSLLSCTILSSISLSAYSAEINYIEVNEDVTDLPNNTGQIIFNPNILPAAPAGIPPEMQPGAPDFFNDPEMMRRLSSPSSISFLQSNPTTEELVDFIYNQLHLTPAVDLQADFQGPNNFADSTRSYMLSPAFIAHLQSAPVQAALVLDKMVLTSPGADTVSAAPYIKFLGNHTISVNTWHHPPAPPDTFPHMISMIDLNGKNARLDLNAGEPPVPELGLLLGSVVDSVGGGSLDVQIFGDKTRLILNGGPAPSNNSPIIPAQNIYQNVNFTFNSTNQYLFGLGSNDEIPLILTGSMTNDHNANLVVGKNLVISNNNPVINFASIVHPPEVLISRLVIDNPSIAKTTINSKWQKTIELAGESKYVASPAILHAKTPIIITDGSIGISDPPATIPPILKIGYTDRDSSVTLATDSNEVHLGAVFYYSKNSSLILDNENAGGDTQFLMTDNSGILGTMIFDPNKGFGAATDAAGKIELRAMGNKLTFSKQTNAFGIGFSDKLRANEVKFSGDSPIIMDAPIKSQKLDFDNASTVTLKQDANLGTESIIDVNQDATLEIDPGVELKADATTINLGSNNLNLSSGKMTLTGKAKIYSDFNSAQGNNGRITVGGGANPATLNIGGLESFDVIFSADTSNENLMTKIGGEYSLKFLETIDGGGINDGGSDVNVNLIPTDSNLLVSWEFDEETQSLVSKTDWEGLAEIVKANQANLPQSVVNVVKSVTDSANKYVNDIENINALAKEAGIKSAHFIQAITQGAKTKDDALRTLKAIKAELDNRDDAGIAEQSNILMDRMLANSMTSELSSSFNMEPANLTPISPPITTIPSDGAGFTPTNTIPAANNGSFQTASQSQSEADAKILGEGVAAGDDVKSKYGVWFSPFYQKGIQRKIGINNGYKVRNHGGIIGADYKISDSASIGFAWSNIKSILRETDEMEGSKAVTHSNIFSLYGALELPKNYFVTAIASHGISNIKNSERRPLTATKFEFAKSKYKTRIYSGQILGGRNIPFRRRDYIFTPLLGLKYTEFHDDAYNETGVRYLNYKLAKKKSSLLDLLAGAKLVYNTQYKGYNISPHIGGMAHINLKDNPATSYISSDAFLNTIRVEGEKKAQKAWYTINVGIDISKDNMEYAISYENQIDKKYVGHQAKLKVKVNF